MNIRDYVNQSNKNSSEPKFNDTDAEKFYEDNKDRVKDLEQDINKYKDLSQNELMAELMKEASKLKANGSLNESSLQALKSTLSPMLSAEQNETLNNILNMIK